MASKRKARSDCDKVKIIEAYDKLGPKISQREAVQLLTAGGFDLNQSCLSKILKDRKTLLSSSPSSNKRKRLGKFQELEVALDKWIHNARDKDTPLSGPIIKAKAEKFATELGIAEFKASDGWFSNFKKRNELIFKRLHGEAAAADKMGKEEWLANVWPALRAKYAAHQIWNADETGLYHRALPDSTFVHKNEEKAGGKKSKERLTVLFCVSWTGEKRTPFVIGKSAKPRCFNGVKKLPARYRANKSAWMTSLLFVEWLQEWDQELRRKREKVLLLLDNCSAHPKEIALENIELAFLPANTTSLLQPLDQGIIRAFKAHFRRSIVLAVLNEIDNGSASDAATLAKKITVLDAMISLQVAWDSVRTETIVNCWCKGGLHEGDVEDLAEDVMAPPTDDVTQDQWNDWIDIDDDLQVIEVMTDERIVEEVTRQFHPEQDADSDSDDEDEVPIPTRKQMMEHFHMLKLGLMARGLEHQHFKQLTQIENEMHHLTKGEVKQTKMSSFFGKK